VGIRAAIILALSAVAVAGMHILNNRSELGRENSEYRNRMQDKNDLIGDLQQELSGKNGGCQVE
ncbi:MAG: hypothetical protein R6U98_34760, partial [Pirellulaceae bacterium]